MTRKDQLNIPIDSGLKDKWKDWARKHGTTITELITSLAAHCVEGEPLVLPGGVVESDGVARQEFDELVKKFELLETRLSSLPSLKEVEEVPTPTPDQSVVVEDLPTAIATYPLVLPDDGLKHGELAELLRVKPDTPKHWPKRGVPDNYPPYQYNKQTKRWHSPLPTAIGTTFYHMNFGSEAKIEAT